jgi:hypothetical protein
LRASILAYKCKGDYDRAIATPRLAASAGASKKPTAMNAAVDLRIIMA